MPRPHVEITPAMRAYTALYVEKWRARTPMEVKRLAEQMDAALALIYAERKLPWFPTVFDRSGK